MVDEIQKDTQQINEAKILEPERVLETPEKKPKKKYDFYVELVLFFILGILVGVAIKTEAVKRITIGFDDYKMNIVKQDYDINKIQANMIQEQAKSAQSNEENNGSVSRESENNATNQ